jgi:hypothetical protein
MPIIIPAGDAAGTLFVTLRAQLDRKILNQHAPRRETILGLPMTSHIETPSLSEVCARVRHLGYAASGRVRLYGEEFDVVSDPFPEAEGIAVRVTTKKDSKIRVLQLPATVLQSVRGRIPNVA